MLADTAAIEAARPALETLGDSLSGTGVTLELSGPWPAYSFARKALEHPA
ncbi:GvpL/GvpF family gas vesicle protein [Teichococcus aestuarii]